MEVFKEDRTLVGYTPIELSNQIDYFLNNSEENFMSAVAVVPKKREVRLVVPVKFTAVTKQLRFATVLLKEILKRKFSF